MIWGSIYFLHSISVCLLLYQNYKVHVAINCTSLNILCHISFPLLTCRSFSFTALTLSQLLVFPLSSWLYIFLWSLGFGSCWIPGVNFPIVFSSSGSKFGKRDDNLTGMWVTWKYVYEIDGVIAQLIDKCLTHYFSTQLFAESVRWLIEFDAYVFYFYIFDFSSCLIVLGYRVIRKKYFSLNSELDWFFWKLDLSDFAGWYKYFCCILGLLHWSKVETQLVYYNDCQMWKVDEALFLD